MPLLSNMNVNEFCTDVNLFMPCSCLAHALYALERPGDALRGLGALCDVVERFGDALGRMAKSKSYARFESRDPRAVHVCNATGELSVYMYI